MTKVKERRMWNHREHLARVVQREISNSDRPFQTCYRELVLRLNNTDDSKTAQDVLRMACGLKA